MNLAPSLGPSPCQRQPATGPGVRWAAVGLACAGLLVPLLITSPAAATTPPPAPAAASPATAPAAAPQPLLSPRPGRWQQWGLDRQPHATHTPPRNRPRLPHRQPGAASVWLIAGKDWRLRVPTRLRAGRTTFDVSADFLSHVSIARPVRGYSPKQLVRDVGSHTRQARARVKYCARLGGGARSMLRSPGQFSTTLYPGTYWIFDDFEVMMSGEKAIHAVTVTGPPRPAAFPRVSGMVRLMNNGPVRRSPSIGSTSDVLLVNSSDQQNAVVLAGLKPGKTLRDFRAWVRGGLKGPEPLDENRFEVTATFSPGQSFITAVDLPRGRYVVSPLSGDDLHEVRSIWVL